MIKMGYIATTYSHRGELKVIPLTNNPDEYEKLEYLYLFKNNGYEKIYIENLRYHKKFFIIRFKGVPDMNSAEKLRESYLYLPEDQLEKLPEDHFYIYQLIGFDVYEDERYLGKLREIVETGSNDVFIVKGNEKDILVPALKSVVKEINFSEKKISVQLPEGLLD